MLEWDDLRHVLAVHREGSLTQAAESLGVARTTVGRRLRQAEARLGVPLFDRTPEGLVATVAGRDLADTAQRVEEEILASEGRVLGRDAALRGALRVSVADFVYEGFTHVFASFVERYPGVSLTVATTDGYVSLRRREADVVIRLGNAPDDALVGRRVAQVRSGLYAAPALVERIGAGAPLADWPWVGWDPHAESRWLDAWLAAHAPGARVVLRVSSIAACVCSVREGIGVHFLPAFLADGLVDLGVPLEGEARALWALTLPELRTNRRVRAFLDHAYAAFGAQHSQKE